MAAVKVTELDELLVTLISESDHPEIVSVTAVATENRPDDHTRVRVDFASGATAIVMVRTVGRGNHEPYKLPAGAIA